MIAVDLGNTRAKFGFFPRSDVPFPIPQFVLIDKPGDWNSLSGWLDALPAGKTEPIRWVIGRTGGFPWEELQEKIAAHRPRDRFKELARRDIPCAAAVRSQERIGLDRLLAALGAAAHWKSLPENAANHSTLLVVDAGTATTIDSVSTRAPEPFVGTCGGGAIFPGFEALATALARISPKLPKLPTAHLSSADYPGLDTEEALAAGIYWGTIGAIRQFRQMVRKTLRGEGRPDHLPIYLTGGDAENLAKGLSSFDDSPPPVVLPHLVLSGIALAPI